MFRAHVLIIRRSKLHYTACGIITSMFISRLYMFRAHVLITRSKLHYTASGIITPIGVYFMPLHVSSTCAHHQEVKIALHTLWYHHTYVYFTPVHVSSTYAHHQEVKTALHSLWYHHTDRCDDTRGCVMRFWPPDDEHMCSKHVQAWNKLIVKQKFRASSWLITEINILRCTVSKTSKNY